MPSRIALLKDVAAQRIRYLFKLAGIKARSGDHELARRYVEIALKLSKKARIRLSKSYKRGYCRKCLVPLIPGITLSVRVRSEGRGSKVVYRCLLCGWTRRYMIKTSRRRSRQESPAR